MDNRLTKAHSAFGRLYSRVWSSKYLKKATKISIYRAVVLSILLIRLRDVEQCRRSILNIHWSDYVTNVEVLQQAGITSIEFHSAENAATLAGLGKSPEWRLIAYARSSSTVNSPRGIATEEHRRKDSEAFLRNPVSLPH